MQFRYAVRAVLVLFWATLLPLLAFGQGERPYLSVEPGGHTARVMRVLFRDTPSRGLEVISVGSDKAIRVWSAETGRQTRTLRARIGPGARGIFDAATLSPDGRLLAVTGFEERARNSRVRLFDLETGQITRALDHPNNGITDLAFSRDGRLLAACSDRSNPLWVWDLATGAARDLKGHKELVNQIAFGPDGRLVSGSADATARIWDAAGQGKELKSLPHDGEVRSVAWSPDGKTIATGGQDGSVTLWNADGAADPAPRPLPRQKNAVLCLAFNRDGLLATGQGETDRGDTTVRVWTTVAAGGGAEKSVFGEHKESVLSVAFSPDGRLAASADFDGTIYLWDPATGALRQRLAGTGVPVTTVAWSPNPQARIVAWGSAPDATRNVNPTVRTFFNVEAGAPTPDAPPGPWRGAVHSLPDGKRLALSADGLAVRVLDGNRELRKIQLSEDRLPLTLPGGSTITRGRDMDRDNLVRTFTATPDGRIVVGSVFSLALFDAAGRWQREFVGHSGEVLAVSVSPDGRYLASASADQTVRIWDLGRQDRVVYPLLSLFADQNGRWIAWTNEGYFAASPGGDRLIGWQVNRGPEEAAEFYPAERFWRLLYRPDVISRLLRTGSVTLALAEADAHRPEKTDARMVVENLAQFKPPQVTVLEPKDGAVVTTDRIPVRLLLADPNQRRIVRVHVTVNLSSGRNLDFDPQPGAEWTEEVPLQPDAENRITVIAVNDAGVESKPEYIRVICRSPARRRPNLYLLAIGVSKYDSRDVNPLQFADKDARDFAAAYRKQEGMLFDRVHARALTDPSATKERILQDLRAFCSQPVQVEDYAVVFLAGHGGPIDAKSNNRSYCFMPCNAVRGRLDETGASGEEILETLRGLNCNVLLVLDTCREGSRLVYADDPELQMQFLTGKVKYGRVTFFSCQPNERSQEKEEWGNGAFTRKFIEGIQGAADSGPSSDGMVSLAELDDYLRKAVPAITSPHQNPRMEIPYYVPLVPDRFPVARTRPAAGR